MLVKWPHGLIPPVGPPAASAGAVAFTQAGKRRSSRVKANAPTVALRTRPQRPPSREGTWGLRRPGEPNANAHPPAPPRTKEKQARAVARKQWRAGSKHQRHPSGLSGTSAFEAKFPRRGDSDWCKVSFRLKITSNEASDNCLFSHIPATNHKIRLIL